MRCKIHIHEHGHLLREEIIACLKYHVVVGGFFSGHTSKKYSVLIFKFTVGLGFFFARGFSDILVCICFVAIFSNHHSSSSNQTRHFLRNILNVLGSTNSLQQRVSPVFHIIQGMECLNLIESTVNILFKMSYCNLVNNMIK